MIVTSAFIVPGQDDADGFDDLVLEGTFFRPADFDGHDVIAYRLFLQRDRPQGDVVGYRAHRAVVVDPLDADGTAIEFVDPFAKLFPGFLWDFGRHKSFLRRMVHRVRPRAFGFRFTLLLFKRRMLGERRRARPPLLWPETFFFGFQRSAITSVRFIASGT